MRAVEDFYDGLAAVYDLIYPDWAASIERQSAALEQIIRTNDPASKRVADVACGIGTQSLGLASRGFEVIASDLSPGALRRARREADLRGLQIEFRLDDMQRLAAHRDESMDAVIACDNAVPHLLTDAAITGAFRRFRDILRPGGVCVISVRDYEAIEREPVRFVPYGLRERDGRRYVVFQVWEFRGALYDLDMYFSSDDGESVRTEVFRSTYYAISIKRLSELMAGAGLVDVRRVDDMFFQPLIVSRRA